MTDSKSRWVLVLLLASANCQAENEHPVWDEGQAPYSKPHELEEYEAECWFTACAYQVHEATLNVFKPEAGGTGDVILILPGGSIGKINGLSGVDFLTDTAD